MTSSTGDSSFFDDFFLVLVDFLAVVFVDFVLVLLLLVAADLGLVAFLVGVFLGVSLAFDLSSSSAFALVLLLGVFSALAVVFAALLDAGFLVAVFFLVVVLVPFFSSSLSSVLLEVCFFVAIS